MRAARQGLDAALHIVVAVGCHRVRDTPDSPALPEADGVEAATAEPAALAAARLAVAHSVTARHAQGHPSVAALVVARYAMAEAAVARFALVRPPVPGNAVPRW